jgi:hypothetical protein
MQTAGVLPSMGRRGDAFDNALAESFFATLETELLDRHSFRSRDEGRLPYTARRQRSRAMSTRQLEPTPGRRPLVEHTVEADHPTGACRRQGRAEERRQARARTPSRSGRPAPA